MSLFIIQVAALSWAATQVPEITLAIQSCLKAGFLRAVQVEYLVMIGNEGPIFGDAPGPQKSRKGRGEEVCGEIGCLPTQFWNGN